MPEIAFSLGSKQHDDVVYILDHDWKETSLINELVSIMYLSAQKNTKNLNEDIVLTRDNMRNSFWQKKLD